MITHQWDKAGDFGAVGHFPPFGPLNTVSFHQNLRQRVDLTPNLVGVFAELYCDGEVVAVSQPATFGPASHPACCCSALFEMRDLKPSSQRFGVRSYALLADGSRHYIQVLNEDAPDDYSRLIQGS